MCCHGSPAEDMAGGCWARPPAQLRGLGAASGAWWAPEADESIQQFLLGVRWAPDGPRRVLDTGEGTFTEIRYAGSLDLLLV